MTEDLPTGWTEVALSDVCRSVSQRGPSAAEAEFRYIDLGAIDNKTKRVVDASTLATAAAPSRAKQVVAGGDVLFSTVRIYLENIALIPSELDGAIASTAFTVLRPTTAVEPGYLYRWVTSKPFIQAVNALQRGNSPPSVQDGDVKSQRLPLPPLAEQQRIVSRIEELFSEIDEGERALERVGRLVERYRQSVLKAAVTGELTAKARQGGAFEGESGADVLERALSRRDHLVAHQLSRGAPVEPDVAGLPALPAGWVWASVDQLCGQFGNGLSRKPAHEPPGTPILRISSVRPLAVDAADVRYYAEEAGERLDGYFVANGDLLFTRYNGSRELVGVSGVYRGDSPVLHPDKLIKARVISSGLVLPDYLEIALNAGESWKFLTSCVKTSAGQHGIAGADIKRAPVPLPPFNEQREIVALWRQFESQVGALKSSVPTEARRGQALRQSILKAAFSGQLVPQDPRDEPASALLARLAAQASDAPVTPRRRGRPAGRRSSQPNPSVTP